MLAATVFLAACASTAPAPTSASVPVSAPASALAPPRVVILPSGQIKAFIVVGDVRVRDHDGKLKPLVRGDLLELGSTVLTGADGMALVGFSNGNAVQLKPNSQLELTAFQQAPFDDKEGDNTFTRLQADPSQSVTTLNLISGTLVTRVRPLNVEAGSTFTIKTPAGRTLTNGAILQVQVMLGDDGKFSLVDVAVAQGVAEFDLVLNNLGTGLAPPHTRIWAGGQLKISHTPGNYAVMGSTFTGDEAAAVINSLYAAINEILSNEMPESVPSPPTVPHLPEGIYAR